MDHQLDAVSAELEACAAGFVKDTPTARSLSRCGPVRRTRVVRADRLFEPAATGVAADFHVVRHRVDHQDLHGHRDNAARSARPRGARRTSDDVPAGTEGRGRLPWVQSSAVTIRRMLSHESGLAEEPPGTDWVHVRSRRCPERGAATGERDRHQGPPEHPGEVLEPRLPLVGRGRDPGQRHAVRGLRPRRDPRTTRR